jgi:hypothetical protein
MVRFWAELHWDEWYAGVWLYGALSLIFFFSRSIPSAGLDVYTHNRLLLESQAEEIMDKTVSHHVPRPFLR